MPEKIGKLLAGALKRSGAERSVRASLVLENCRQVLEELFGPEDSAECRPTSFRAGTVRIVCSRSVFAERLRLREGDIVQALEMRLPRSGVRRLRISS
ncbi:hypothetical protein AMJ57_03200 [Parcubacteria bacterium SG8_24]|nr:MAG: hypothetical protein AMJ57_03200 [Parcubacteria bacterium SG8_24]